MTEKKELWMEYSRGESGKTRINLYDTETLVDILSAGGTKAPVWDGDLDISDCGLEQLPDLSRIEVAGVFNVSGNYIKTMDGSPYRVGGDYLANNTRFGAPIDDVYGDRAFMEGFPAEGIGGDLQIMLTRVDGQCVRAPGEREAGLAIVKELQARVVGKIWTSAILWEARNRIAEEMCGLEWNDPKRSELMVENVYLGDLVGKMMTKTPAAEVRDVEAAKNIRAENKKYREKRYPKTVAPTAEEMPRQEDICVAVHEWATKTIEGIREELNENYDSRTGSKEDSSPKKEEALDVQRRILLVKMFVLSEVIKINQSDKPVKVQPQSVDLFNRARHSFGLKDEKARGEGLSLKGLERRVDALWRPTQAAFGLNEQRTKTR